MILFIKVVISIDLNCDNVGTELHPWRHAFLPIALFFTKQNLILHKDGYAASCAPLLLHCPYSRSLPAVTLAANPYEPACWAVLKPLYASFFTKQN